jgi:putative ABC transport system permease protein
MSRTQFPWVRHRREKGGLYRVRHFPWVRHRREKNPVVAAPTGKAELRGGLEGELRGGLKGEPRSRLRVADAASAAAIGLRGRPTRAALSAAGVALGVATLVGVLGISSSSRAQLVAEIDALGTNLLTVTPSPMVNSGQPTLPNTAPGMVARIGPVIGASAIGDVSANVYRNDRIPLANTGGITVYAAGSGLLRTLQGHMARGRFLNAATARLPAVVLGYDAATALGIDLAGGPAQVWLGDHWFGVAGIMRRLPLAPELDRAALIGFGVAERLLHSAGAPVEIYVRTYPASVGAVESVLAATADPAAPQDAEVTNPADALTARADASAAFQSLFLALGAVALLVGGIGIANVMVISVLERRGEIGLRRALGAARVHIAVQFIGEAALLAAFGGAGGALLGAVATTGYSAAQHWSTVVPVPALLAATGLAVGVGALAGLYPALKAARLAPAEALRSV